jgi:hypothetical protein
MSDRLVSIAGNFRTIFKQMLIQIHLTTTVRGIQVTERAIQSESIVKRRKWGDPK